jgi:hypothetical protein
LKQLLALVLGAVMLVVIAQPASASEDHFPLYGVRGNSGANLDK